MNEHLKKIAIELGICQRHFTTDEELTECVINSVKRQTNYIVQRLKYIDKIEEELKLYKAKSEVNPLGENKQ